MNEITIYTQGQPLAVKEYRGQRVITFKDMDRLHQHPTGTARRNFNANRRRFIEGEDFFIVKPADIQMDEIRTSEINNRGTVLLTKMGYLMLVKSFADDLAWMVQRQLVKGYFEAHPDKGEQPQLLQQSAIQGLEQRIAVLECPAKLDSLSAVFLQAIQQALDSGAYYIRKKNRPVSVPVGRELVGVYDDYSVRLLSKFSYDVYAATTDEPIPINAIWRILAQSGTIKKGGNARKVHIIPGKDRGFISLELGKLRILEAIKD